MTECSECLNPVLVALSTVFLMCVGWVLCNIQRANINEMADGSQPPR